MEIKEALAQIGLSGKKADVYLATLELGGSNVIEISRKSGVKRTTAYDILLDLIKEGLVSETIKGKKRFFIGEDPEKILKEIKRKETFFSEILPELKTIHNIGGGRPKIRYYEGTQGLKDVYADTLNYTGEMLAFASEDVLKTLGKDWAEDYLKKRVKKQLHVRAIMKGSETIKKDFFVRDQEQLRTSKLVDPQKYPFSIEINIYGHGKVAMMSSKELTGVIIESQEIFNTLKMIFQLCWDLLPEVRKD